MSTIMDSLQDVAGGDDISYLQYHSRARFIATVSNMAATQRIVAQGFMSLGNMEIAQEPVRAHVVFVPVYHFFPCLSEEALVPVLAQYGKLKAITHATFRDRSVARNSTRVVKMEMSKSVPTLSTSRDTG
ncbi:hypothetical protein HPB47_009018 [Ixodes persulcatus]|uniref:Uncharacterized protein n=1 Tax=Ixodes persulcatus TaxID=34615 RepID=A0AC60P352_IXOPE|nr:hypothetical protein HPB47_009018 [Ixodes persulcatus]